MTNTLTHILPRTGSVCFGIGPKYAQPILVEMPTQCSGRDSLGDQYIYQHQSNTRCLHRLSWSNRSETILDALLLFYTAAQGCKYDFTWTDHLGGDHLVRFPREQINWKQTGPDRYDISIGLEESVRMVLIDETGSTLIDENGNTITF